jgi:hypothetical protein
MLPDQDFKDWFIRYAYFFSKRYTNKQKKGFLEAITADIKEFRTDIKIDRFNFCSTNYTNLYVGNVKEANKIICTNYDTATTQILPYEYFNIKSRKKNTLLLIIVTSTIYFLFGLLFLKFIAIPIFKKNSFFSFAYITLIFFFVIYFYIFGKISKGWATRKTIKQNTSTVLTILSLSKKFKKIGNKNVAFAFLDAGCTNEAGLIQLIKKKRKSTKVFLGANIGADSNLMEIAMDKTSLERKNIEVAKDFESDLLDENVISIISAEQGLDGKTLILPNNRKRGSNLNYTNINEFCKLVK